MRARILVGLLVLTASFEAARAEDGQECFSKYTRANVCEFARGVQVKLAPSLPTQVSSQAVARSIVAVGPVIVLSVMWTMTRAEFDRLMISNGVPVGDIPPRMDVMAQNAACASRELAAFIRLGGRVRWAYSTSDNRPFHTATIDACPAA